MKLHSPGPLRLYARYCAVFLLAQVALLYAGTGMWARWAQNAHEQSEHAEARRVHAMLAERLLAHPDGDPRALLRAIENETGYPLQLLALNELPGTIAPDDRRRLQRLPGTVVLEEGRSYRRLGTGDYVLAVGDWTDGPVEVEGQFTWIGLWLALATAVAVPLYFLIHRLWHDIRTLQRAVGYLRANCFDHPVPPMRTALLKPLAVALQDMAEQMRLLLDGQRLMGQAMAHELRTPLARIRFTASLLQAAREDAQEHDVLLREVDTDIQHLDRLSTAGIEYIRFGRMPLVDRSEVALPALMDAVVAHVQARTEVVIRHRCAPGLVVNAHSAALELALRNVLANAVRHARALVSVHAQIESAGVCIRVEDDGAGIPVADRERVFKPYVRLGTAGGGFGLGLAMVKTIVERHSGTVDIADSGIGGAMVVLRLPL
ncbi:hypothetical protein ABW45_13930 [Stenotrophomonas maltophilia]|nr:ATP-binding protein [Stenotrophomonas pavanii]KOQ75298.1 hypothetical protein ABW45_13930 [Stenotrophomonas maltophilia]